MGMHVKLSHKVFLHVCSKGSAEGMTLCIFLRQQRRGWTPRR